MLKKYIAALLFLITLPLAAQVDRSKMPEPGPAPEIKIGDVESFTLDNGLKVFVVENDKLPTVTFSLELKRDPIFEGDNAGYVQVAGDLLRAGTTSKTKAEIDEAIDFIGANLSTSSSSVYGFTLTKHLDEFMGIMADVIKNPSFPEDELEKVKKQYISALAADSNDPNSIANKVRRALVYGLDHPYGEMMTEETVGTVTSDMCKIYYDTYFRPNIAYLAIVGDISADDAEDLVKEYLGDWQKGEVPSHTYETPKSPVVSKVAMVDRPSSVQSVIHITYPVILEKNSEDVIKSSVMNAIAGGSFSSRFNQNLREDKGYTYGARSSLASDELVGSFDANCEARNEVTDSAITEFLSEMETLVKEPVSDDELTATIAYLNGSFSRSLENPRTVARFAINTEKYDLPEDYYKNYLKNLAGVTKEDVHNMAKKYLKPDQSYILVVGNGAEVSGDISKFSSDGEVDYYDIYGKKVDKAAMEVPAGVTVDDIINNYAEALGGMEKVNSIQDYTQKLSGEMQGMKLEMVNQYKAPNKQRNETTVMGMTQLEVFNGETGRQEAMGQNAPFEGKDLEDKKIVADNYFELKTDKYNIQKELTGIDKVNGKEAYVVKFTFPSGTEKTTYFDKESGLLTKTTSMIETPQGNFEQSAVFKDYKEVDGYIFPHTIEMSVGPQSFKLNVESIEVNTGLEDSVFE